MSKSKNKGFLLIEIMLAVTILSVGLVLVLRSFTSSLQAIKTTQDYFIANFLLEEKIWQKAEQNSSPKGIIAEEEAGTFDLPFDNFNYKISFAEEQDLPSLHKSTFEVFWKQRRKEYSTSCVTYLMSKEE